MYICTLCACLAPSESVEAPGTGVTDTCVLTCESWGPDLGPLQKQQVLLTAEPSRQPPSLIFFLKFTIILFM